MSLVMCPNTNALSLGSIVLFSTSGTNQLRTLEYWESMSPKSFRQAMPLKGYESLYVVDPNDPAPDCVSVVHALPFKSCNLWTILPTSNNVSCESQIVEQSRICDFVRPLTIAYTEARFTTKRHDCPRNQRPSKKEVSRYRLAMCNVLSSTGNIVPWYSYVR